MVDLFNQPKLTMDFTPLHSRENNPASELHLEQFRKKFTRDCYEVLQKLVAGERLTVRGAIIEGLSGHLPRRIADLKAFKIPIHAEFLNGEKFKTYYMDEVDKSKLAELLLSKMEIAA